MSGERRVFRASAPVRLDFAGGWTDVAPFAVEERGVVVNAAIELRAHADVEPGGERYLLLSEDTGKSAELCGGVWSPENAAELALHKAALRRADLGPGVVRTRSDVPPGSGLGSSGALGVALVAALDFARGMRRTAEEIAEEAFQLEAVEAGLPGGKQDQYAAALGGFHRLRFADRTVQIEPLVLEPAFAAALQERIVVCYTGTSRVSSDTISRVMGAYARGDTAVADALHCMVEVADRMAEALRASDLAQVGLLLSTNWRLQQQLDRGMRTEEMARLEAAMTLTGALGGKAAGAGAGGSMFFLVRDPAAAAGAARAAGGQVLPFTWAHQGVKAW